MSTIKNVGGQSAEELEDGTPKLIDPGSAGWAHEPKVTTAELLLYGNQAGIVRLLGQAAVDAGEAYSLACKRAQTPQSSEGEMLLEDLIRTTWDLYVTARVTHRDVAETAIGLHRSTSTTNGLALTSGLG